MKRKHSSNYGSSTGFSDNMLLQRVWAGCLTTARAQWRRKTYLLWFKLPCSHSLLRNPHPKTRYKSIATGIALTEHGVTKTSMW